MHCYIERIQNPASAVLLGSGINKLGGGRFQIICPDLFWLYVRRTKQFAKQDKPEKGVLLFGVLLNVSGTLLLTLAYISDIAIIFAPVSSTMP